MVKEVEEIQKEIVTGLIWASTGYGRAGIQLMLGGIYGGKNYQAALGNFAIATELLLKAYIANQNLSLLYKGLSAELRCALVAPESLPPGFRMMPHLVDLKSSKYKTLEMNDVIGQFYIFEPEIRKRHQAELKFISGHRNNCVHAVHPEFKDYEVERSAFLMFSLVEHFVEKYPDIVRFREWGERGSVEKFMKRYDESRIERLDEKVKAAAEKAKTLTEKTTLDASEWDWYPTLCPICGSDGFYNGETEADSGYDGLELTFYPESFECDECGLVLDDFYEMETVGVPTDGVDRTDESEDWIRDNYHDYY